MRRPCEYYYSPELGRYAKEKIWKMNIYFSADYHFNHADIIKYTNRPFYRQNDLIGDCELSKKVWVSDKIKLKRTEEMNNAIIRNHNSVLSKDDVLYHLGDFYFKGKTTKQMFEQKLNGSIVHVCGNHDMNNKNKTYIDKMFLVFGGLYVLAQHHPVKNISEIPYDVDLILCGHVHNKWKINFVDNILMINVGIDVWDYKPVSIKSLIKLYRKYRM